MKKTIFQCVTAILCVIAICITGSVSMGKIADAEIEAAKLAAEKAPATQGESVDTSTDTSFESETPVDDGTAADTPADAETPTDAPATDTPNATDTPAGDSAPKAPQTTAEITKYYNDAVNKVISSKAGFNKSRTTTLSDLNGGILLKLSIVVEKINSFLGVGTNSYNNTKGKADNICKASLTASDVTAAKCTVDGDIYTITMTLKDGKSSSDGTTITDTSPLNKTGLFVGKGKAKALDYKNADNIYFGINDEEKASTTGARCDTFAPKITAKINAKTGNFVSLTIEFDWHVYLSSVKYAGVGNIDADGKANTVTKFTNFVY